MSTETMTTTTASANVTERPKQGWWAVLRSPLWLCLLVALIIRVWLVVRTNGAIDGDEALLGVQAEHILRGELPIYFYGQPYLGSLEAYLVAILFAIAGPSVWTLRAEPMLLSLVVVALTWKLAGILADMAQLPADARRSFTISAALLAAIPPLYDGIIELRTFGGYIETFILMLLLLIAALQLTQRWYDGAPWGEMAWRWAGIGFVVGLGFWVYPLIISAVLAATLWIAGNCITRIAQSRQYVAATLRGLLAAIAAIPAGLVGFAPALYWGATHQWQNITYILGLGATGSTDRISTIIKVTKLYLICVGPRVVSGAVPKEAGPSIMLHTTLLITGLLCILIVATLVFFSLLASQSSLLRIRRLAGLPLLFAACTAFSFCASSASASGLISTCDVDFAGRYATPLLLVLPFFFAALFTLIILTIRRRGADQPVSSDDAFIPARPAVNRPRLAVLQGMALAFLLLYLGVQTWTYGLTDTTTTFQSPFCLEAPVNDDAIIAYMQREHIHYAWAANLLGYPIVFKTNGAIIIANPLALVHPPLAINRIPAYTAAIEQADRPSILAFAQHNDAHPPLLAMLDREQVIYRVARFPSQPGIDVLVVTPLNRTVRPFESPAFNTFFICGE